MRRRRLATTYSRSLTEQCRDPEYVGLDLKSRIASNNVCAKRSCNSSTNSGSISSNGGDENAHRVRATRSGAATVPARRQLVFKSLRHRWTDVTASQKSSVACAMSKKGEDLLLDFTGHQRRDDRQHQFNLGRNHRSNCGGHDRFPTERAWSDGRLRPVKINVPEGSILNCTFPAACGEAPAVGVQAKIAVSDCIARMLYSAGDQDINAPWQGIWYAGGPGSLTAAITATASPSPKVSTTAMGPDWARRPRATELIPADT